MNRVKAFFKKFGRALARAFKRAYRFIVSDDAMDRVSETAQQLAEIAEKVLPVVQLVATLTPNRTDDQIVALVQAAGAGIKTFTGMSDEQKKAALKASAVALARKQFPELRTIDDATLYAAIDIAYRLLKDLEPVVLPEG